MEVVVELLDFCLFLCFGGEWVVVGGWVDWKLSDVDLMCDVIGWIWWDGLSDGSYIWGWDGKG